LFSKVGVYDFMKVIKKLDGLILKRRICKKCWHNEMSPLGKNSLFPSFIELWEGGVQRFGESICVLEVDFEKREYPLETDVPPRGCPHILEHLILSGS